LFWLYFRVRASSFYLLCMFIPVVRVINCKSRKITVCSNFVTQLCYNAAIITIWQRGYSRYLTALMFSPTISPYLHKEQNKQNNHIFFCLQVYGFRSNFINSYSVFEHVKSLGRLASLMGKLELSNFHKACTYEQC